MQSGTLIFPVIERLIYGEPAAQAVAAEAERRGAQRVFIMSSGTLNRNTGEVTKMCDALGARLFTRIVQRKVCKPRAVHAVSSGVATTDCKRPGSLRFYVI